MFEANCTTSQGIFRTGVPVIDGRPHSNTLGLRSFLIRDTGPAVFRNEYNIYNGFLHLRISVNGGRDNYVRGIGGLSDLRRIYTATREEQLDDGGRGKVLYGWARKNDRGLPEKVRIKYILAERDPDGAWKILKTPQPLEGLTLRQQARRAHRPTIEAVTQGLGDKVYGRWWNVEQGEDRGACVCYEYDGERRLIYGFAGLEKAFSLIFEKEDRIMARFYRGPEEAARDEGLIVEAVLSVRAVNGQGPGWRPLMFPAVTAARQDNPVQRGRVNSHNIKRFLLDNNLREGDALDLEPRRVYQDGGTQIYLQSNNGQRGVISLGGFKGYSAIFGRIIVKPDGKRVYFWPDALSREKGERPIIPKGQLLAQRGPGGKYEIVWWDFSSRKRQLHDESLKYGEFLFADAGENLHFGIWPVRTDRRSGPLRKHAIRQIRGATKRVSLVRNRDIDNQVWACTRELRGRIKLVEFWRNEKEYQSGEGPLQARFISFKPSRGDWMHFWAKMEEINKFRVLIQKGLLTLSELEQIVGAPYLDDKYHGEMLYLVDTFRLHDLHR